MNGAPRQYQLHSIQDSFARTTDRTVAGGAFISVSTKMVQPMFVDGGRIGRSESTCTKH